MDDLDDLDDLDGLIHPFVGELSFESAAPGSGSFGSGISVESGWVDCHPAGVLKPVIVSVFGAVVV